MGFTINEKITTELTYKEIALIAVALGEYQLNIGGIGKEKHIAEARILTDRLGREMYDVREKDDADTDSNCALCDVSASLLKKYMTLIIDCEGTDFLYKIETMQDTQKWTDEEADALTELSELISNAR